MPRPLPEEWAGLAECCRWLGIDVRSFDESGAQALEAQFTAIHVIGSVKESPRGIQLRDFWTQPFISGFASRWPTEGPDTTLEKEN